MTLGITVSARAQWVVYDPANTIQSVINTAQEIAKFVEVVNNQVQQIQTLTDQLNEFKHYESLFGDPKAVLLTTVQPLVTDLRKTELGQTLTALEGAVNALLLWPRASCQTGRDRAGLCAFCPGVAVAVESHLQHTNRLAPLLEFGRSISGLEFNNALRASYGRRHDLH